jgi:hypothetical protein
MLAARCGQPIDGQHQSAITQRRSIATARFTEPVERRFEAELTPQVARHQHRLLAAYAAVGDRLAVQQAHQFREIEMCRQQVLAPEIEHRAVPCLAVLPKRFDHTHILVGDAFATSGPDHTQEHGSSETCPCEEDHDS